MSVRVPISFFIRWTHSNTLVVRSLSRSVSHAHAVSRSLLSLMLGSRCGSPAWLTLSLLTLSLLTLSLLTLNTQRMSKPHLSAPVQGSAGYQHASMSTHDAALVAPALIAAPAFATPAVAAVPYARRRRTPMPYARRRAVRARRRRTPEVVPRLCRP